MVDEHAESVKNLQPKELTSRHRKLMRLLVSGMTLKASAEILDYNYQRASIIVNTPIFKDEMEKMQKGIDKEFVEAEAQKISSDPIREAMEGLRTDAIKTLSLSLRDDSGHVKLNAAKDILDRTGYAKEDKLKAHVLVEPTQALIDVIGRMLKEKDAGTTANPKTGDAPTGPTK